MKKLRSDKVRILRSAGWRVYFGADYVLLIDPQNKQFKSINKAWQHYQDELTGSSQLPLPLRYRL